MHVLPFLERRRDGWGVAGNLLLLGTWLEGWGRPLVTMLPGGLFCCPTPGSLLRMRCEDEEGESLVREREFGPKLWRKDLGELKGSQGPLPPFPLGVPFTPDELYPAL